MKGDTRSSVCDVLGTRLGLCDGARLPICGLSTRLTGGGGLIDCLNDPSRRSSPDLLGGGGSGADGDFRNSNRGVCGLLKTRWCLGEAELRLGCTGEGEVSALSKLGVVGREDPGVPALGGELGGSIVTAGKEAEGTMEIGLGCDGLLLCKVCNVWPFVKFDRRTACGIASTDEVVLELEP